MNAAHEPRPPELYAALIALEGDHLLLPNSAVAEVLGQDRLLPPGPGAPVWLAGRCAVGGQTLPVVRFEVLNGLRPQAGEPRGRLILLNLVDGRLPGGQLVLLAQSHPQLLQLNPAALQPQPLRAGDRDDLVAGRLRLASTEALIPDLQGLEAELLLRLGPV